MLATPSQQNTREPRKELPMLKIEAVVRPERTSTVLEALTAAGVKGYSYWNITGKGQQEGVEVFTGRGGHLSHRVALPKDDDHDCHSRRNERCSHQQHRRVRPNWRRRSDWRRQDLRFSDRRRHARQLRRNRPKQRSCDQSIRKRITKLNSRCHGPSGTGCLIHNAPFALERGASVASGVCPVRLADVLSLQRPCKINNMAQERSSVG